MRFSKIATAAWLLIALFVPVHAFPLEKVIWQLGEHQPDMLEGGRANSVAVNPANRDELLAASDSGGLFKSSDAGLSWTHVDKLPVTFTQDVVYVSSSVILVSAKAGFKATNGGDVWRSTNGGGDWAPAHLAALIPGFTGRLHAYGMSASGNNVIVGTSKGVFVSTNGGGSWIWADPFNGVATDIYSVLVTPGSPARLYAGGPAGIRLGTLPLGNWVSPTTSTAGGIWSIHAFARSPLSHLHAFVLAGHSLFRTEDRGATWTMIPPPQNAQAGCGGATFIKAAWDDFPNFLDLYLGDVCDLFRLDLRVVGTSLDYSVAPGAWQRLSTDRSGMCDLTFFQTDPVLLATTGGLHTTSDVGSTWRFVASGREGYGALQITELTGQFVECVPNKFGGCSQITDLYFATRENFLWTANTRAHVNPLTDHRAVDAFYLEAERRVPTPAESRITWRTDDAKVRQSGRRFTGETNWLGPNGGSDAPVLIQRDRYVQSAGGSGLQETLNAGVNWQPFASFIEETRGIPRLARAGTGKGATIFYQALRANLSGPPSEGATRLLRVHHSQGTGVAVHPAMAGFGGLGTRQTPFATYPVFGVDSRLWFHVIAPDIISGQMMETWDGGESWNGMPGLTSLVTNTGDLLFHTELDGWDGAPLVTAVSFSPQDPSLVLVGTSEGGIFFSSDRGETWKKVIDSERATHVTSFFWENANTIFISTYGRGLWKLGNRRIVVADAFNQFCAGCDVVSNDGAPGRPPFDASVLVFEGRILGVRTDNRRLREVFVTPGSSVLFTGDLKDEQEDIAITEGDGEGPYEPLPKGPDGWIVTGVVFTSDDTLTGTAFAESELILAPPEK